MKLSPGELAILGQRLEFDAEVADTEAAFRTICLRPIHRKEFMCDDEGYELTIKAAWLMREARHNNELNDQMALAIGKVILSD